MGMSSLLTEDSLKYYLTSDVVMARPTGWELSLHTDDPGIDGDDNEVADTGYARQGVSFEMQTNTLSEPFAQNDTLVVFPPADDGYTITHVVVWDVLGMPLVIQRLQTPKTIITNEQAQVAPSEIKIGVM